MREDSKIAPKVIMGVIVWWVGCEENDLSIPQCALFIVKSYSPLFVLVFLSIPATLNPLTKDVPS